MEVRFAKLKEGAKIPSKRNEDMGLDIYACFEENEISIPAHTTSMIPTGLASVVPKGWGVLLEERGSTGSIGLKRSAGVVDSGYRGEWFVALTNTNRYPVVITKSVDKTKTVRYGFLKLRKKLLYPYTKAICQAILIRVPDYTTSEITIEDLKLFSSERGEGKLGASGK